MRYIIGYRRGAGAHGLGQGINHLVMEMEILFHAQCSIYIRTIATFSGREDCFSKKPNKLKTS